MSAAIIIIALEILRAGNTEAGKQEAYDAR